MHTPIPHCFLDGITRQTAISIAEKQGIKVVQRDIYPEEIKDGFEGNKELLKALKVYLEEHDVSEEDEYIDEDEFDEDEWD